MEGAGGRQPHFLPLSSERLPERSPRCPALKQDTISRLAPGVKPGFGVLTRAPQSPLGLGVKASGRCLLRSC